MDPFIFIFLASAIALIGFVVTDLVMSRALFAFAAALLVYAIASGEGTFLALLWALAAMLLNLTVIWRHVADRFTVPLSEEETALAQELTAFSPGDFRRLMKIATWQTLDAPLQLTEQGRHADALYYIVSGGATVNKSGKEIEVGDNVLIGEISFTQDIPTTASVEAHEGSVLISWPAKKLHKLLKRSSLKASFDAVLAHDLAEKLAADELRRAESEAV